MSDEHLLSPVTLFPALWNGSMARVFGFHNALVVAFEIAAFSPLWLSAAGGWSAVERLLARVSVDEERTTVTES
jgi:hypothetical protein